MGNVDSMYGIPQYSGDSKQYNYMSRGEIFLQFSSTKIKQQKSKEKQNH